MWRDLVALSHRNKREAYGSGGSSYGSGPAGPSAGVNSPEAPAHMDSAPPGTALASACNCNAGNKCPKGEWTFLFGKFHFNQKGYSAKFVSVR